MRLTIKIVSLILILVLWVGSGSANPEMVTQSWQAKIDGEVLSAIAGGRTDFILYLSDQADLSGAIYLKTKQEKGQYVYQRLTAVARRSQKPIITSLTGSGADFRPYWIANMIWVRGDLDVLSAMAMRSDVDHIFANPKTQMEKPLVDPFGTSPQAASSIEWNISRVRAPEVWAAGYRGQGITIGGQDTGYDWDHPALKEQYRGWDGLSADHNYNWHDAIHDSSGNPCGNDAAEPCDDHNPGHGTHTMGTMVGKDASLTHQIGMAPEAKWIGCRNMDQGVGSPATYAECYQWFLAPTDLNNLNPDPAKAPDVINNSWSCPLDEGCVDPQVLQSVVEAVRAAGILSVHSAGNKGQAGCSSIDTPAAIYDASFTVGNTTSTDTIAASSSQGPVMIDGSGRIKPDISAPGTAILSSVKGDKYAILSGTSMAGPHVAGLAALLFSAQPDLIGQVDHIERLITRTAVPVQVIPNDISCGGIPGTVYPNNFSGWGRIDALAAYQGHALWPEKTASSDQILPGDEIIYSLTVGHSAVQSPATDILLSDVLPENTIFIDATGPYTFDGSTVSWEFANMEPIDSRVVEMKVQVAESFLGTIVNDRYQVESAEVTSPVIGDPVLTEVIPLYQIHIPLVSVNH